MPESSLQTYLTSLVAQMLATPDDRTLGQKAAFGPEFRPKAGAGGSAPEIAKQLIAEAIASGLPFTHLKTEQDALGGGNTAEVVAKLTLHVPFVFKLDGRQEKLAKEAGMMRVVKNDVNLPMRFRNAWPVVYAVRDEPPYAYLMEIFPASDGWHSLEDRLYPEDGPVPPSDVDAVRFLHAVLDILFEGYEASKATRSLPNVAEDYVGRIRGRATDAANRDPRFGSRPLTVNGVPFVPWQSYLDLIDRNASFLSSITPPFSTVTHGDPNPGNLMLRTTTSEVELKLIDPKEWLTGDYLFDIAKITHFIEGTGPIEKPVYGAALKLAYTEHDGKADLAYSFGTPTWTGMLVDACLARVEQFARRHGDLHWRARYELGMASNLLGLPIGRLTHPTNPRPEAALALYGEGLKWLARFCNRLEDKEKLERISIAAADAGIVEPEALQRARSLVREKVPHAREGEDSRGFQLLEWKPVRANEAGKPIELSLEHEARLKPVSQRKLAELQSTLARSEGLSIGKFLFPDGSPDNRLIVRRYQRDFGAQSLDRYFDIKGAPAERRLTRGPNLRFFPVWARMRLSLHWKSSAALPWSATISTGKRLRSSPSKGPTRIMHRTRSGACSG